jgi:hypothetical protein
VTDNASNQEVSRVLIDFIYDADRYASGDQKITNYSSPYSFGPQRSGEYAIAVAGLTKDDQFDGRLGYTRFTVPKGQSSEEIHVDISEDYGMSISGTVTAINSDIPLKGKPVYLCGFPIQSPFDPTIESCPIGIRKAILDKNGNFTFSRTIPGNNYLHFIEDEYIQKDEVKVTVEEGVPSTDITVPVCGVGKLTGEIKYPENRDPSYISLKLQNEDPSIPKQWATIYDNGRFEIEKAYSGKATLSAIAGFHPNLINETVTINTFETTEQNYDFSSTVLTSFNRLKINDKFCPFYINKSNANSIHFRHPYKYGGKEKSILLPPGDYTLFCGSTEKWPLETITIPDTEATYQLDNNYTVCDIRFITGSISTSLEITKKPTTLRYTRKSNDGETTHGEITIDKETLESFCLFKTGTYEFTGELNENKKIISEPIDIVKGKNKVTLKIEKKMEKSE